jgi:hypothetical protein
MLLGMLALAATGCKKEVVSLVDDGGGRTPADFPELADDVFQPMDGGIEFTEEEIKGRNTWNTDPFHDWRVAPPDGAPRPRANRPGFAKVSGHFHASCGPPGASGIGCTTACYTRSCTNTFSPPRPACRTTRSSRA